MGKKETVPNRRYTDEFKTEAVRLALSTGGNAAAKRLGVDHDELGPAQSRWGIGASVGYGDGS
jgi:transposase